MLAWSLYTLGHPNQINVPYLDNVDSPEDAEHRKSLQELAAHNCWSFPQILTLAHMSCELAFKAMVLHTSIHKGFPKIHCLKTLLKRLNNDFKEDLEAQFNQWTSQTIKVQLSQICSKSGSRFIKQRYGEINLNRTESGVLVLSKFLHTIYVHD